MIDKLVTIDISHMLTERMPYCGYMEIWNPFPEELIALIPYLEEHRKICLVWLYGNVDTLPDYTPVDNIRIARPAYLGGTREDAYARYVKIRGVVMDNLETNNWEAPNVKI